MKLKNLFGFMAPVGKFVARHDMTILTVTTVGATLAAVYFAATDTPKCKQVLEELDEDATNIEKAKAVLPVVGRTMMATAVAVGCALLMNARAAEHINSLTSMLTLSQTAKNEYREYIAKEKGEEELDKMDRDLSRKKAAAAYPDIQCKGNAIMTGHGNDLIFDCYSGRFFYSDINFIKKVEAEIYKRTAYEDYITVNEFYMELDLPETDCGKNNVFMSGVADIELAIDAELDEADKPYTIISFRREPVSMFEVRSRRY